MQVFPFKRNSRPGGGVQMENFQVSKGTFPLEQNSRPGGGCKSTFFSPLISFDPSLQLTPPHNPQGTPRGKLHTHLLTLCFFFKRAPRATFYPSAGHFWPLAHVLGTPVVRYLGKFWIFMWFCSVFVLAIRHYETLYVIWGSTNYRPYGAVWGRTKPCGALWSRAES